jgi:hypothetical protein
VEGFDGGSGGIEFSLGGGEGAEGRGLAGGVVLQGEAGNDDAGGREELVGGMVQMQKSAFAVFGLPA